MRYFNKCTATFDFIFAKKEKFIFKRHLDGRLFSMYRYTLYSTRYATQFGTLSLCLLQNNSNIFHISFFQHWSVTFICNGTPIGALRNAKIGISDPTMKQKWSNFTFCRNRNIFVETSFLLLGYVILERTLRKPMI